MSESVRPKPWEGNENTPNSTGRRKLAATMLRHLAQPWAGGESIKTVITRTAKAAGLTFWRTSDLWYAKTRRVEDFEMEMIDLALTAKTRKETANELSELRSRLARLESRLVQTDEGFYREDIAALGFALRRSR